MRIEIPDDYVIGPLTQFLNRDAQSQGYRLIGDIDGGEPVVRMKPVQAGAQRTIPMIGSMPPIKPSRAGLAATLATWPGMRDLHDNVVPITQAKAARGGNAPLPPRAA